MAREFVLMFRRGKPIVKSGRPGLLLEATLGCDWKGFHDEEGDFHPSASQRAFLALWESEDPKWRWQKLTLGIFLTRRGPHRAAPEDAPWWVYQIPGRLARHGDWYLRDIVRNVAGVLLGRAGEPEVWTTAPPSIRTAARLARLQASVPSRRYERIRNLVEKHVRSSHFKAPAPQPVGMELWPVLELAYGAYHPFPEEWLKRYGSLRTARPAFCFFAANWWMAALAEIAWAVEHDVWARVCRYPSCDIWFLQAGRQGRRREFCERHKRVGPPTRYRERLRREFPEYFGVLERLRNLAAQAKRGTISSDTFEAQNAKLRDTLKWYRTLGKAP
jgi:hypothetical protein